MSTKLKSALAATLMSGAAVFAGMSLGAGTAQAGCNSLAMCSWQWCPGEPLPMDDVVWDMSICHTYYGGSPGHRGTVGGIPVGAHIMEGEPSP
jgi:hypothetical protein